MQLVKFVTFNLSLCNASNNVVLGIFQSGATCVIHTASPVPGSKNTALFWKVNVDGTKAVIKASQELGVRKLVYTSSAGVAFNGSDVINADERRAPPLPPMDVYNETKTKAEELVIQANGEKGLLTVALRPAGIFGCEKMSAVFLSLTYLRHHGQTRGPCLGHCLSRSL